MQNAPEPTGRNIPVRRRIVRDIALLMPRLAAFRTDVPDLA